MIAFIHVENKNLRRRMRKLNKDLPHAMDVGLLNWMTAVMVIARSRAPQQTGALRASVYAYVSRAKGHMGFAAPYAVYAEQLSTKPFFFIGALEENKYKLAGHVKRQLDKVMKGKEPHENRSQDIARSKAEAYAKGKDKNPRGFPK